MNRKFLILLPLTVILMYLLLATAKLFYPGVNYDEIFFGNAAFGGVADNTFVKTRILGIPLFILEYIGALKAWLYYPIFHLFGVTVWSIRFPMILLSASSLFLLYKSVEGIWGKGSALLVLMLTATDPVFVSMTRVDFGPVVISFFFRVFALNLFFFFLRSKKTKYVFWLALVLLLGWFNKMDFIWFILAFIVSAVIFYGKVLYGQFLAKLNRNLQITGAVLIILFAGVFGFIAAKYGFFATIDLFYFSHLIRVLQSTVQLLGGTFFYNTMYKPLDNLAYLAYGTFVSIVILANTFWEVIRRKNGKTEYLFLFVVSGLIYVQIIITSKAGAPWHLIYLYPFVQLFLARSIWNTFKLAGKKGKTIGAMLLVLIVGHQLFMNAQYISAYGKPTSSVHWSAAIYDLADYTHKSDYRFISVDWGTHNQLLVLDYQQGKYFDEWPRFVPDPIPAMNRIFLINAHYMNSKSLFILHSVQRTEFRQTRLNFFKLAQDLKMEPKLIKSINDGNVPAYEIYRMEPSGGVK